MFRPIPAIIRFSSEIVLVFIRFMRLCNDGEISSSVVLIITTVKRRGWGVLQCGYCTDLACNARVSVYFRCSCPMRDSSLLSIHHQCLSSMSVTYSCDFYFMESAEGWNLKQSNNPRTQGMLPTHPLKKKSKDCFQFQKPLTCEERVCYVWHVPAAVGNTFQHLLYLRWLKPNVTCHELKQDRHCK